ncbi:chaperone DnaJ-domain superfamily protein [Striga asiatica]|uniref:Chaperone DnaJ-domain superfamily protein n=1 Tax=Striga asiatica TaxID=4170 RepID=A0A5A7PW63_STRAF|nr:chaperone DnaJ-domain superfamily protein [Striga asiatica]
MDESWRMRMGMPKMPPPPTGYPPDHLPGRLTAAAASHRRQNTISDEPLNPEDFDDVFGGPPRTVLSGRFATACQRSRSTSSSSGGFIYEEIFRPADRAPPPAAAGRTGRMLPEFRIPGEKGSDFYSDIFGWEDHERVVRSRSRSKASSSSVLSSEELSPLQPAAAVDGQDDILWRESGWFAVSLSDLTEISQVKKAYQKARLCLHPDKLQQRGATIQQKYIADKAFSLLQDAWEAFVAQRVS